MVLSTILLSVISHGREEPEVFMDNFGEHLWRIVFGPNAGEPSILEVSLYRDGLLVVGPIPTLEHIRPFQRILWWVESDAIASIKAIKFFLGGGVIPG